MIISKLNKRQDSWENESIEIALYIGIDFVTKLGNYHLVRLLPSKRRSITLRILKFRIVFGKDSHSLFRFDSKR